MDWQQVKNNAYFSNRLSTINKMTRKIQNRYPLIFEELLQQGTLPKAETGNIGWCIAVFLGGGYIQVSANYQRKRQNPMP